MLEEVLATRTQDLYFTHLLTVSWLKINCRVYFTNFLKLLLILISFKGIILVHDLTNRKSEGNLRKWLAEVLTKECNGNTLSSVRTVNPSRNQDIDEYDPEQFIGSSQV
jgi:hypothetical protein